MGGSESYYRDYNFTKAYDRLQEEFITKSTIFDVGQIQFPLSTKGMAIVDRQGRRVKLAGGNWSGGHASRHCLGGLEYQPIQTLCKDIRETFGMNCVRVTFSLQLFRKNNIINEKFIKSNPQFKGMTSIQLFKQTVDLITKNGLMVILNNHTSKSQWCCTNSDGDGLWFNKQYSEQDFFTCLQQLAVMFRKNERVVAIDIRNQVRKSDSGSPTWGDGSKFDWKKAAETAANRIHKKVAHLLIIIGGMNYQTDFTQVIKNPIQLQVPNKLVYSGHLYYFTWGPSLLWKCFSQQYFRERLFNQQLAVRAVTGGAPFLMGEFGNNTRDEYWIYLIKYMKELDLDWTYWCLDGYKCDKQQDETYGVWNQKFNRARHPDMLEDLKFIAKPINRT